MRQIVGKYQMSNRDILLALSVFLMRERPELAAGVAQTVAVEFEAVPDPDKPGSKMIRAEVTFYGPEEA